MVDVTDQLYLHDAYLREFTATVSEVSGSRVALDRTAFYPTGGGQPHDLGELNGRPIREVRKEGDTVWHALDDADIAAFAPGDDVAGRIDWERRHRLMRTHTALHVLCGVIWNEWGVTVTGGNMEPLSARMDFDFDPLPEGFAERVEALVNAEIELDRPIEVSFLARADALADDSLIRTKINLVPEAVRQVRVVDIVGLDRQADGGTHVRSLGEVGRFRVTRTESKGKANKRLRIAVEDAAAGV